MVSISPTERLLELGGIATRGTLLRSCERVDLDRAVTAGDIIRIARGRYALAVVDADARTAVRLSGVLALTSAALHHGWAVKTVPDRPHLMVSRGRHVALAIADSALRAGVPQAVLDRIAEAARGPGSPQMRRVAACASGEAANPFESVLRAIALDVPGLSVLPQVTIREPDIVARPDLVDEALRIVLEADSFEWHGGRAQLSADARRYDLLVVNGWLVLRFSYEHVMTQPDFVRRVLVAAVALAERMREVGLLVTPAA